MNPQARLQSNPINEPPFLKDLSRSKIYKLLAEEYFIPNPTCRAISRDYLIGVHTGKYFRVRLPTLKKFMVDMTPSLMKKTVHTTNHEIVEKLEALLKEHGLAPLGFKKGNLPDSEWLDKMARFIDPCNAADLFEHPVCRPDEGKEIDSNRVLIAKKAAEKKMLGDTGLLGKREVMEEVRELWEAQKKLKSRQVELELLRTRGTELVRNIEKENGEVETRLTKTTETVLRRLEGKEGGKGEGEEEEMVRRQRVKDVYAGDNQDFGSCICQTQCWKGDRR
jgi:hypothetical protein